MSQYTLIERLRAAQLRGNTAPCESRLLEEAAAALEGLSALAESWCDESGTSVAYAKRQCAKQLRRLLR